MTGFQPGLDISSSTILEMFVTTAVQMDFNLLTVIQKQNKTIAQLKAEHLYSALHGTNHLKALRLLTFKEHLYLVSVH